MTPPTIHLDAPNLGELEKEYVNNCLDSSFVSTHGPFVPEFELKFGSFLGGNQTVAVQSGTAGLHMVLYELGIGKGDEVILPVLTFAATANAIKYVGAKPVFMDVDPLTWNMDPALLREAITGRTKAIIPVHVYGNPCSMNEIVSIAKKNDLYIIEDATESLGAEYSGKQTGTFGDFGVFSFNGNKIMTTGGGGMITGKDEEKIAHIRFLINQARDEGIGYFHPEIGFNFRMTNLEASLGLAQLQRVEEFIEKKRTINKIYSTHLKNMEGLKLQMPYEESQSVWWMSSIIIDTEKVGIKIRDIQELLKKKGVPSRRIFMPLVESPPYFEKDKYKYSNAYDIYEKGLNLPSSTLNSNDDIEYAADALISILKKSRRSIFTPDTVNTVGFISDRFQEKESHDIR